MSGKVRIGIIGVGKIAEVQISGLRASSKIDLVAVADVNETRAMEVARDLKIEEERVYKDYHDLLRCDDVDAVAICTPNFLHVPMAIDAAKAGKHILLQKPMALSVDEAQRAIDAAKQANVKLMSVFFLRFSRPYQRAKKYIEEGLIGDVFMIRSQMAHHGVYDFWPATSQWFFSKKKAGGGSMVDLGTHLADVAAWLVGSKITSVFGEYGTLVHNLDEVEDNGIMLVRFANGAIGELVTSWSTQKGNFMRTEIYGSKGTIFLGINGELEVYSTVDRIPTELRGWIAPEVNIFEADEPWKKLADHFAECILEGKEPITTGEDGKRALAVCLAGYKSCDEGRRIYLPE